MSITLNPDGTITSHNASMQEVLSLIRCYVEVDVSTMEVKLKSNTLVKHNYLPMCSKTSRINGYRFVLRPDTYEHIEHYDVFKDHKPIGDVELRNGWFSVYSNVPNECALYRHQFPLQYNIFPTKLDRTECLTKATEVLTKYYKNEVISNAK